MFNMMSNAVINGYFLKHFSVFPQLLNKNFILLNFTYFTHVSATHQVYDVLNRIIIIIINLNPR